MADNTWVALDTITVANTSTNTIQFLNIPSTYKNLVVVANLRSSDGRTGYQSVSYTFNGGGGSTAYGATILYGNGTNALSYNQNNAGVFEGLTFMDGGNPNRFYNNTLNIMDYANPSKWKSVLIDMSDSNLGAYKSAGTWRNTAAITSVEIKEASNLPWVVGSTATLYGIAAVGQTPAAKATGGFIYSDADYFYHVFSASGTFTPSASLSTDVLVVAGGGGGGSAAGGGGGAGGLLIQSGRSCSSGTPYTVTVGAGGAGSAGDGGSGSTGANSVFDTITANGGGGGTHNVGGLNGGSGGGAGYGGSWSGGTTTQGNSGGATGYGFAGGGNARTTGGSPYQSGGGGGAGGVGGTANNSDAGVGGIGRTDSFINAIGAATGAGETINGVTYFAGGGGGSYEGRVYAGGYGGGGRGGTVISGGAALAPTRGRLGTGGGAGGGNRDGSYNGPSNNAGLPGGSGIVVIRYAKA